MCAGHQRGTDTGASSGEGADGDHTHYGVLYDHINATVYWRTVTNHNFQRLRLADAKLEAGSKPLSLPLNKGLLPWFHDAAAALRPPQA